jgi:hypothetical protein
MNIPGAQRRETLACGYCCFLVGESEELAAPALDPPVLLPLADPEAPPDVEPLMPPLAPGAALELLELAGGVVALVEPDALPLMPPLAPGAELELLELAGGVVAPGAELELLLELPGAVLGAVVLEPLLEDEVPGRVASPDFCGEVGLRSQPVAASAVATAAATSVRWVSLCITGLLWVGMVAPRAGRDGSEATDIV